MARSKDSPKHTPERTCITCRQKRPKRELTRIVRTPQGTVEIDPGGKKAGRGAYLCNVQNCWEIGLKKKRLEHGLQVELTPEQCVELLEYGKTLSPNGGH